METNTQYDVAIIGSGIAGSTLGAILARNGLKVIIFEFKSHPRFAIGESMILETSETLRAMAQIYSVPELAFFSSENYFSHIGTSHGVKRHFSYLYHSQNQEQNPQQCLQAVIPKQPYGHELHLHRQDTDYFLMTVAVRYGVRVLQNTGVKDVNITAAGVEVITDKGDSFNAEYVVDAGGFRSILANKFDLRDTNLQTHSRAIFTHMVDVPCYHQVGTSQQEYGIPFRVSEGTLHHLFKGGWLWVIPFNNHPQGTNPLCSVGLMLDPRIHPQRQDLSPEAEFYSFVEQFPGISTHFRHSKAVRDWTRTGRIQYSSKQIVGDRFCLLGHAAGFIDPLFSKGLYTSLMSVSVLADLLINANKTKDYSRSNFQVLEDTTLAFIHSGDRLIANAYKSFGNYKLWSVYSVLWLLGAYLELLKLTSVRVQSNTRHEYYSQIRKLKLVGGAFDEFDTLSEKIHKIVENTNIDIELEVDKAVANIKALYQGIIWMPHAFMEVVRGKNHLPVNKLKPTLLKRQGGFLGVGSYRQYFFNNLSASSIIKFFLWEKAKHSIKFFR
ncbi:MAG: NAD(P)/FAD-dependent oxidoreductase [Nostocaceae cyanobacterium]|nr:NAD(P)/FAD-dependent oxidoreductase [Nostocaceae cyanobacterium]